MNWFIYISGWAIGWGIFNALFDTRELEKKNEDFALVAKIAMWTMFWVWFCWKFISVVPKS
jgi:hypothetical protein